MTKSEAKKKILKFIQDNMDQNKKCQFDRDNLEARYKIPGVEIDEILEELSRARKIDLISPIGTNRIITVLF